MCASCKQRLPHFSRTLTSCFCEIAAIRGRHHPFLPFFCVSTNIYQQLCGVHALAINLKGSSIKLHTVVAWGQKWSFCVLRRPFSLDEEQFEGYLVGYNLLTRDEMWRIICMCGTPVDEFVCLRTTITNNWTSDVWLQDFTTIW